MMSGYDTHSLVMNLNHPTHRLKLETRRCLAKGMDHDHEPPQFSVRKARNQNILAALQVEKPLPSREIIC